jgi:hypothetical protein
MDFIRGFTKGIGAGRDYGFFLVAHPAESHRYASQHFPYGNLQPQRGIGAKSLLSGRARRFRATEQTKENPNYRKQPIMKTFLTRSILAAVAATVLTTLSATAQTAVTTTTTSAGTITEFSPDSLVIRTDTATAPLHYRYTKSTTYVDEAGNPVSVETVKSGLPVTVYYSGEGENMVATKVIVRKTVSTGGGTEVEHKSSTTTTTTDK